MPQGSVLGTFVKSPNYKQTTVSILQTALDKQLKHWQKESSFWEEEHQHSINFAAECKAADTTEWLLFSQTASCVQRNTFKQQALVAFASFLFFTVLLKDGQSKQVKSDAFSLP